MPAASVLDAVQRHVYLVCKALEKHQDLLQEVLVIADAHNYWDISVGTLEYLIEFVTGRATALIVGARARPQQLTLAWVSVWGLRSGDGGLGTTNGALLSQGLLAWGIILLGVLALFEVGAERVSSSSVLNEVGIQEKLVLVKVTVFIVRTVVVSPEDLIIIVILSFGANTVLVEEQQSLVWRKELTFFGTCSSLS